MTNRIPGKLISPTKTKLEGREPPVTDLMRARAFWLLRRYTSLIYIERQYVLWTKVIEGLKNDAGRASDPYTIRWFMTVLGELYRYQAAYEAGLDLLRQGDKSGYDSIVVGADASTYLHSPTFDNDDYGWLALGDEKKRPLVGILAWGRRAYTMARNTLTTLRAEWTYEKFQEPEFAEAESVFPKNLPPAPLPRPGALQCSPGDTVPTGGVWLPIDRRLGCFNYFMTEWEVPEAMSTVRHWAFPSDEDGPGDSGYIYERRPSRWELVWEDDRYAGGNIPEELEYLSDDIKLPNEPLQLLPFP